MVDYSKWKDIEISDDEDETHPNIDTPSLFRWRHQARVERMEEQKKEREEFENKRTTHKKRYEKTVQDLKEKESKGLDVGDLKKALTQLEAEAAEIRKYEEDIKRKEKVTPWNVDTISQPGFTKTIVNKPAARAKEELSEEEKDEKFRAFVKENKTLLEQFGMLKRYDDSKRFLLEHPHLTCEETANYLVIWCINLEMEDKHNLMEHVAHQCICMQYILELSKHLDTDPRACVGAFFSRIQLADEQYKAEFQQELTSFRARIVQRAQEKLDAALQEIEEKEREKRLGPGGLDPVEVYESLPEELRKCFDEREIDMLKETIAKMPPDEAAYHMKRCVDSGLWVPDAKAAEATEESTQDKDTEESTREKDTEEENIYSTVEEKS
ncbi:hsp90 co-chaperone Cdc37 [Planococcus citri]|uniref:hsp90 co-chaperone Cdc37 n=1 Tax=Planococcus citri TaxID=170843 RepID=UPI0031F96B04